MAQVRPTGELIRCMVAEVDSDDDDDDDDDH